MRPPPWSAVLGHTDLRRPLLRPYPPNRPAWRLGISDLGCPADLGRTLLGPSNPARARVVRPQHLEGRRLVGRRDDYAEAAAHVEDLAHLPVADLAELLDQGEDRRDRQRVVDLVGDLGLEPEQVAQATR